MKVVVCYKNVPNADSIEVNADNSLDFSNAVYELGQYDMNALEAAAQIAANGVNNQVIAITAANKVVDDSKLRKAVLSRGVDKLIGIKDEALDTADAYVVAQALAAAIKTLGDVDAVIFGEGSGDAYSQQTGVLTGALLGWNTVNGVCAIDVREGKICVTRSGPDMEECLEIQLPAAICVTGDINKPRIPTFKEIMAAGKKPAELITAQQLGVVMENTVETVNLVAPASTERKQIVYEKASDEAYAEIAQMIRNAL